jgi:hypothetical protein
MNTLMKLLILLVVAVSLAACGSLSRDRRDAAWDPKTHGQLLDQVPAWEGAANKICCGHLRECKTYQSPRC